MTTQLLTRPRARALVATASAAALAAAFTWTATAGAAGTPRPDNPGTPPATAEVTTKQVFAGTQVTFTGTGWLTTAGAPQRFYVKFDDHGGTGIGPYVAQADGTVTATVSMVPPPGATLKQQQDWAPEDLNTPGTHWLRFLAGPYAQFPDNDPARSVHATFTVVAAPDVPSPDPTPAPGAPTPGAPLPAPAPGEPGDTAVTPPALVKGSIARASNRLVVRVRGGSARTGVALVVRSAAPVRLAPGTRPRTVLLAKLRTAVAPDGVRTLRPRLTPAGRRALAHNGTLRATVQLKRAGASTTTAKVSVRG